MTTGSPADGGSFDVTSATGFPTPPSTTLAADLDDVDGVATLTDGSSFDQSGEIKVGTERIHYASRSGNTLNDITRGVGGTTVANHLSGATVRQPRTVVVGREIIVYHTLSSDTLGDIRRGSTPAAHADLDPVGPTPVDIDVDSVAGFLEAGGRFQVGNEWFVYESIDTLTLERCARAAYGSSLEAHADAAAVTAAAYTLLDPAAVGGRRDRPRLYLPNRSGVKINRGDMVKPGGVVGTGGVVAAGDGDAILGIALEDAEDDCWLAIQAGGYFALRIDALHSEFTPGDGEPIFAASATTLKSLEAATAGDEAAGYCLRTHDVDPGGTAISPVRVDVLMVSTLAAPYTK